MARVMYRVSGEIRNHELHRPGKKGTRYMEYAWIISVLMAIGIIYRLSMRSYPGSILYEHQFFTDFAYGSYVYFPVLCGIILFYTAFKYFIAGRCVSDFLRERPEDENDAGDPEPETPDDP